MTRKLTYSETPENLRWVADVLEDSGFHDYAIYNGGALYNVKDANGITQTFYPTTGTILFHRSDDNYDRVSKSIRANDSSDDSIKKALDLFMWYLERPEEIQKMF